MIKHKIKSAKLILDKYDLLVDIRFEGTPESIYRPGIGYGSKRDDNVIGLSEGVTVLAGLFKLLEVKTLEEFVGKELYYDEKSVVFTSIDLQRSVDTTKIYHNQE
jgi:hypothetical protein